MNLTRRPATFTEANAWVHLAPESFTRLFPHITTIWQTEEGRVCCLFVAKIIDVERCFTTVRGRCGKNWRFRSAEQPDA